MVLMVLIETARSTNSLLSAFQLAGLSTSSETNKAEITEETNGILNDVIDSNNLIHTLTNNKTVLQTTSKNLEIVE